MLVNRQQEWIQYPVQEQLPKNVAVVSPRPDTSLKRNYLLFVLFVAAAAMLITMQNEMITRAGYDLVELKAQVVKVEKDNEILRLDIAKLKSPDRIQQIATGKLGMIVPQQTFYAAKAAASPAAPVEKQAANGILLVKKAEASKSQ